MAEFWGSFARQGSPALSGQGPAWDPLELGGGLDELPTLLFDAEALTLVRGYRAHLCDFWTLKLG